MLTRLPSVSLKETYCPTPGIAIGSPSTSPPAFVTFSTDSSMSSTAMTIAPCWSGHPGFLGKKSPIDRTGLSGTVVAGFGGDGKNVVSHVLAELLRAPTE